MIQVFTRPFRFLSREVRGMHEAAYLLAGFTLASQFLALVRDHTFAATFGVGHVLDIYNLAFRVPDFIFSTIASLFSLYALLPVLTRWEQASEGKMIAFMRAVLVFFFAGMAIVSVIAFLTAPQLVHYTAPGISDPTLREQLVTLTRILLLQPILLGASNTIASFTQLRHRFVLYSFSQLLYNVGIILGAKILYPLYGVVGLGWGVVFGAAMHLGIQLPLFLTQWPRERVSVREALVGVREVLVLSIPRTLALASTEIGKLIIISIATILSTGSVAVFSFAYALQSVPLSIIGGSYSVAAFPTLAKLFADGEKESFSRAIEAALRHIIFWSVPAAVMIIVLRAHIVRVVLGAGHFDWNATRLTAAALALFVVSLTAQSLILVIARAYYAVGDSKRPLLFGFADIVTAVGASYIFLRIFTTIPIAKAFIESLLRVSDVPGTEVLMLAAGFALGSIVEGIIAYWWCTRDMRVSRMPMVRLFAESLGAAMIGGFIAYRLLDFIGTLFSMGTTLGLIIQAGCAGIVGLAINGIILYALKNRELQEAIVSVRRRFRDISEPGSLQPNDVA